MGLSMPPNRMKRAWAGLPTEQEALSRDRSPSVRSTRGAAFLSVMLSAGAALPPPTVPETSGLRIGDRRDVVPSVVYLHSDSVRTGKVANRVVEMWYRERDPKAVPQPQIDTIVGTGFLVAKDGRHFLVTAKHVVDDFGKQEQRAMFLGQVGKPVDKRLDEVAVSLWTRHPTEDVAAVEINVASAPGAAVVAISLSDLRRIDYEGVMGGPTVLVLGFPLGLGVSPIAFSPIGRWTRIASEDFLHEERTYFILEDPSVAGFSGAPVYDFGKVPLGGGAVGYGRFACNGMISGTLSDSTGGKFAAVVPARFVAETVYLAGSHDPKESGSR